MGGGGGGGGKNERAVNFKFISLITVTCYGRKIWLLIGVFIPA